MGLSGQLGQVFVAVDAERLRGLAVVDACASHGSGRSVIMERYEPSLGARSYVASLDLLEKDVGIDWRTSCRSTELGRARLLTLLARALSC